MDRKALIRRYKAAPRHAGIYRVRNTVNGKSLVGASPDVPAMLNRLRFQLGNSLTLNPDLQRDWAALGPDAFVFEVLDTLTPPADGREWDPADDLRELERLWLEKLLPYGERGYNARPAARG